MQDQGLRAAFGHALVLMVFYALVPLVVGLGLASILNRAKVRGLGFFRTVVFLPQVVAMVVVAVAWRRIYAPDGTLNSLLSAVGLGSLTRGWLGDYTLALPAVGFIGTWFETGLVTVLLLAGMGRISGELYEAARLDGAGPVREFFTVTLPSVRGEIAVALTLTVDRRAADLRPGLRHHPRRPGNGTSVPSYEVYHRAFELGQVGSAAAIGVCLTVIIFVDLVRHHPHRRPGDHMMVSRAERAANYVDPGRLRGVRARSRSSTIVVAALGPDDSGSGTPSASVAGAARRQLRPGLADRPLRHLPAHQPDGVGRSWSRSAWCCRSCPGTRSAPCASAAPPCSSTSSCSAS